MLDISWSTAYKRDYKQAKKRGRSLEKLDAIISKLRQGQKLPPHCRPHALSGKYQKIMECHIESDWLLIYEIKQDLLCLYLLRTGTA